MHYLDEGPRDGELVLCLHGEPTWVYLYRDVIPSLAKHGYRTFAPDLIGFGRSDKPTEPSDHTYERHVGWIETWFKNLDIRDVTLVCHDWGGPIGLRLATEMPERFRRIVVCNTGLPTGDKPLGDAFLAWRKHCQESKDFAIAEMINRGCHTPLTDGERTSFDAPFPDDSYKVGPRQMPMLVPTSPDDPTAVANRKTWDALGRWEKPFMTAFSDGDTFYTGMAEAFQKHVPGAKDQLHVTLSDAGHFLQEDKGEELGDIISEFMINTPM